MNNQNRSDEPTEQINTCQDEPITLREGTHQTIGRGEKVPLAIVQSMRQEETKNEEIPLLGLKRKRAQSSDDSISEDEEEDPETVDIALSQIARLKVDLICKKDKIGALKKRMRTKLDLADREINLLKQQVNYQSTELRQRLIDNRDLIIKLMAEGDRKRELEVQTRQQEEQIKTLIEANNNLVKQNQTLALQKQRQDEIMNDLRARFYGRPLPEQDEF